MKKTSISIAIITLITVSCCRVTEEKPYNQGINITPTPVELTVGEGFFELNNQVVFVSPDENTDKVASYFAKKIKNSTNYQLKITQDNAANNAIRLNISADIDVNDEGYLLSVTSQEVNITAKTPQGLFYGMQTVMQLLPAEIESTRLVRGIVWKIPAVTIKDEPRFKYRGQHLDVCRHFSDVDFIKKQLDVLAMFKINKFHWHLTDDQGWRIEIKKYPLLTEISAKRTEGEGHTYGTYFYTQEQIKEVVAYAKERFIEVIPEIEFPGHGVAALTAYPQFSCTGGPFEVRNVWGISNDIYCAGNDSTFIFLEDIIAEVAPLFESEYFHIGGDEAPKARWQACPKCQAKIEAAGLIEKDGHSAEERLQSYFVQRIEKILAEYGKKIIGWEEILEGGLAPTAIVMSWRGEAGGVTAGNMGHDVIMTPRPWLYLDRYQQDVHVSPVAIGGFLPLSMVYAYDPVPAALDEDKKHHVWGVQANVWTEYLYEPEIIEYRSYPRILALSEIAWSAPEQKNYDDFIRRLENQRVRLEMHNINYFIPIPENDGGTSCEHVAFTDTAVLKLKTLEPTTIVYTVNGRTPNAKSSVYTEPIAITKNTTLKTRSIVQSGRMSDTRTIIFEKQSYTPAVDVTVESGLKAEYYQGVAHRISQLEGVTPIEEETVATPQNVKYRVPGYRELIPEDFYSVVLTGYLNVPEDGVYIFGTTATELWIDNKLFISNEGEVARRAKNSSIALSKGLHPIKIVRLSGIIGGWPPLWYDIYLDMRKESNDNFETLDASRFFHVEN